MNTAKFLDEAGAKLQQIFASSPLGDLEKNIKTTLASLLGRLDLVSREEFEVQKQVLARTREKLERLEARLAELDKP